MKRPHLALLSQSTFLGDRGGGIGRLNLQVCSCMSAARESPDVSRPLTAAVAAAGRGTFTLDGVPRMRERPIQDLVDGLVQLGVSTSCTMGTGCPPVTVEAQGLPSGTVCAPHSTPSLLCSAIYVLARS